ncbi:hypothetical protein RRG08_053000 [Elysia crispata]|uniref:Uncharacterized protein n=1 Tax=Elysia crispata TaxID=231223 RepID=A0AAE0ZLS8_9GAST|nr:hypothetical protein RRG08_053000 [Elysia crispata]
MKSSEFTHNCRDGSALVWAAVYRDHLDTRARGLTCQMETEQGRLKSASPVAENTTIVSTKPTSTSKSVAMRQQHPVVRASRLVCLIMVIFTPLVTTALFHDRIKEKVRFEINLIKKFLLYALPQIKTGPVKTTMGNILFYLNQDLFIDDLTTTDLDKLTVPIYYKLKALVVRLYDRSLRDTLNGSLYIINDLYFCEAYSPRKEKKNGLLLETLKSMVDESGIYGRLASYRTDQRQRLMAIRNLYKENSPEFSSTLEFLVNCSRFVEVMGLYKSAFQKKI